ncbi:MCE family protein [Aldersonia sp. NBC_00410]|uniref:MCE family protein n=1 Tax=Aldersonia sp. NBC_00410 TaxID=2975954 RepID=UPI0022555F00|nr:MCE family protein [Aldersonia sp. NBC_00410]MCX5043357.1 MCE family protein [Aldersonia sp. NBC_00410]
MSEQSWFKRLAAFGLVAGLAVVVVVALTMFVGGFTETVPVTVVSPRAGLVMDPQAKVKMRGVEVGRVASVTEDGEQAVLHLDMNPDKLELIPANSTVNIRSTTVFGAKYVNFVPPASPDAEALAPGSTVPADSVTVEFNTLFQHLSDVLVMLEPEKLNATLGAISEALHGRGEQIGELLSNTNAYLTEINPSLPALQQDFAKAADVTNLYADTAPDLLHIVSNATGIGNTIVDEQDNLDALLLNAIGLADTANTVVSDNEQNLVTAINVLRPTLDLLNLYSPALYCTIVGLGNAVPKANLVMGTYQNSIQLNTGFTYGVDPYTYPDSLPKVNATGGPNCAGLPERTPEDPNAPFIVTDNANVPYVPNTQFKVNGPKIFQILFGELTPVEHR